MNTYGCHNVLDRPGYWARNYDYTTSQTCNDSPPKECWIWIENTMSKDCRYDQKATDPKCAGCKK